MNVTSKILELPASFALFFGGAPGVSFFPGVSPGRSGGVIFRRVIFHEGRLMETVPKLARPHDRRRKGRRRLAERPVRGDENRPPVFLFQKTQDERVGDFVSGEQYLHTARASPPSVVVGFAVEYDGNLGISLRIPAVALEHLDEALATGFQILMKNAPEFGDGGNEVVSINDEPHDFSPVPAPRSKGLKEDVHEFCCFLRVSFDAQGVFYDFLRAIRPARAQEHHVARRCGENSVRRTG